MADDAGPLTDREPRRRARHRVLGRVVNPLNRPLAGLAPWWVPLETTGRRTGLRRTTPLARGPRDGSVNAFARSGPRTLGIDPMLVRIELRS